MHHKHIIEMKQVTDTNTQFEDPSDKRLSEIRNSKLVKSIRKSHANLSSIAEYEENEALSKDSVGT
jgi:hypothetical protein